MAHEGDRNTSCSSKTTSVLCCSSWIGRCVCVCVCVCVRVCGNVAYYIIKLIRVRTACSGCDIFDELQEPSALRHCSADASPINKQLRRRKQIKAQLFNLWAVVCSHSICVGTLNYMYVHTLLTHASGKTNKCLVMSVPPERSQRAKQDHSLGDLSCLTGLRAAGGTAVWYGPCSHLKA